jgi:Zn-dependent metalloprotease
MRRLVMVLALFVLLNAAWGYTPENKKLKEDFYRSSDAKITRESFDLESDTVSISENGLDREIRSFFSKNTLRFGIDPENLVLASSYIAPKPEGLSIIKYAQTYNGLPVYSSKVIAAVMDGKMVTLKSSYYPGIDISTIPTLSQELALEAVGKDLGIPINNAILKPGEPFNLEDLKSQESNDSEKKAGVEDISLVIYPINAGSRFEYHLAYKVVLGLIPSPPAKWVYLVDANNGKVLEKYNKVVYSTLNGQITGQIYPEHPNQGLIVKGFWNETLYHCQGYSSNVFWSGKGNNLYNYIVTKNPISLDGVSSATLEFKTNYSMEEYYDFGYAIVSMDGVNWYILEKYTGIKGNWSTRKIDLSYFIGEQIWIGFLYETDPIVVKDGWYIDDIKVLTNSGTVFNDTADNFTNWNNNGFSVKPQELVSLQALGNTGPDGSYNLSGLPGSFTLCTEPAGPFADVYNVTGMDVKHTAIINTPATHNIDWGLEDTSYKKEQSNVFYHANIVHDFFTRGYPFDIYDMNYQTMADVHYPGTCNAFSDGMYVHFFGAGGGCEATSLYSDIIYHEYTHNVVDHVYTAYLPYIGESGALNEGWADYFAGTINGNPCMAEGFDGDCLRNLTNTYRYPEDIYGEVHDDSRIVSGAAWDLRDMVGNETSDALVINAMKLEPFNFTEYLEDIIVADDDNANLNDGTPHLSEICTAFYENHGILSSYCGYQPPENILLNPGFESGDVNWTDYSSGGYDIITNDSYLAHYGSWFAWMGGYNNAHEYIYQDVTIPSNAEQAYVRFWYWVSTEETTATTPYDTMKVEIRTPGDTLLKSLVTMSNLDESYGYIISQKYNVSEFRGQTIRLKFNTTTDINAPTAFLVDDAELSVVRVVSDSSPPEVTNASANQSDIPDDTDNIPLWGETARLNVTVTDESSISSVAVNLSEIGGSAAKPMLNIGGNIYSATTNASAGTPPRVYNLTVNATDEYGNSNTSIRIQLKVMKNGDTKEDNKVNIGDALRLANNVSYPGNPKYVLSSIYVAEVTGDGKINIGDALRLANNVSYPGNPAYILK